MCMLSVQLEVVPLMQFVATATFGLDVSDVGGTVL